MMVLVLERVPPSLRGELTRWLVEPRAGVFVGRVSAMVRDRLWSRTCRAMKDGAGTLIYVADTEQGYVITTWGDTRRTVVDFDGLSLIRLPQ
ncbi:MAG: type I-E CRISPR-associated endoribonuclease Cas2e [Thermomicrobiales bacterium]